MLDADAVAVVPAEALAPDTLLQDGRFCIELQIGAGGFGMTYLARDTELHRTVVIKECFADGYCRRQDSAVIVDQPAFAASFRQIVTMFIREARSIAMLRHPNIVRVHQVFEENSTAYMVLDLIEGRDLADIIETGDRRLSPDQIHGILVKLLDAIALVHDNNLLHRDISPDNILLDKWFNPILIDFGAVREDGGTKPAAHTSMLVVKDGYSPLEFYSTGAAQGACSDLYALGATMYHLISGEVPEDAQTRFEAIAGGEDDPCTPLAGRFAQFDPVVLDTIDAAMQLDPALRLQSAQEWLSRVEAEQRTQRVIKMPPVAVPLTEITALVTETNRHLSDDTTDVIMTKVPQDRAPSGSLQPASRPDWAAEFNMETARTARRRPGQSHIAEKAARMAKKAMQEDQARALLRRMDHDGPLPKRRRFAGFFSDSLIVQWLGGMRRAI